MRKTYNKLVRDKIPEIIKASGGQPVTRILKDNEYIAELIKKLREETTEFEEERSLEELADIKEVVIALREALGVGAGELEEIRRDKTAKNGRFKKRIFLKSVDD